MKIVVLRGVAILRVGWPARWRPRFRGGLRVDHPSRSNLVQFPRAAPPTRSCGASSRCSSRYHDPIVIEKPRRRLGHRSAPRWR